MALCYWLSRAVEESRSRVALYCVCDVVGKEVVRSGIACRDAKQGKAGTVAAAGISRSVANLSRLAAGDAATFVLEVCLRKDDNRTYFDIGVSDKLTTYGIFLDLILGRDTTSTTT